MVLKTDFKIKYFQYCMGTLTLLLRLPIGTLLPGIDRIKLMTTITQGRALKTQ